MKKIIFSLSIVIGVAALATGATLSYFSDKETSKENTITTGTVDIDVDGQNPWTGNYEMEDMQPGDSKNIDFAIHNVGDYPVKIWQIIKNVKTAENGINEPEQEWYNANHVAEKNNIDSAVDFGMDINSNMVVNKEAEFSISDIKDYYLNLVKLDKPFEPNNGDGILYPGKTIVIKHEYYLNPAKAGNWAQSDKMSFDIEILAQQISAPEPLKLMSFIDNKYNDNKWTSTKDGILGLLKYKSIGDNFDYNFVGKNLPSGTYKLIYYPDPWNNSKTVFLLSDGLNSDGSILASGNVSFDLGIDLPNVGDDNYGHGAKVWLVSTSDLAGDKLSWSPSNDKWLFDSWPGLINYTKGEISNETDTDDPSPPSNPPAGPTTMTAYFNTPGSDIGKQYGYNHDYTSAVANKVYMTYSTPMAGKFSGTIHASGLKPYATYQIKFFGTPTCMDSTNGDDTLNNYIGSIGRWWDNTSNANADDASNSSHCYTGYLVLDYLTADSNGDVTAPDMAVLGDTSYHVLFCGGGTCNSNGNDFSTYGQLDANHPGVQFCKPSGVDGQSQANRGGCGGLTTLASDSYSLKMALTEECFHQLTNGTQNWAEVLTGNINFTIN